MKQLFVVGIGPGDIVGLTGEAASVLSSCDMIFGYSAYIQLIESHFPEKELCSTPMMQEVERCKMALERSAEGRRVAIVCSGDAGVYGMAGPVLELAPQYPDVDVIVVPGVTAAQSGGAVLGAPLGHDFAIISLSDLLTPWPLIEKRLQLVSEADFCICLYNPRSKKRREHLTKASELMLVHKPGNTICGWVKNIGRNGQEFGILKLSALTDFDADMFTTIFVGNSQTMEINGRMVTPRGYGALK